MVKLTLYISKRSVLPMGAGARPNGTSQPGTPASCFAALLAKMRMREADPPVQKNLTSPNRSLTSSADVMPRWKKASTSPGGWGFDTLTDANGRTHRTAAARGCLRARAACENITRSAAEWPSVPRLTGRRKLALF